MRNEGASLREVKIDARTVTRAGTTYEQDTTNIGQQRRSGRKPSAVQPDALTVEELDVIRKSNRRYGPAEHPYPAGPASCLRLHSSKPAMTFSRGVVALDASGSLRASTGFIPKRSNPRHIA